MTEALWFVTGYVGLLVVAFGFVFALGRASRRLEESLDVERPLRVTARRIAQASAEASPVGR